VRFELLLGLRVTMRANGVVLEKGRARMPPGAARLLSLSAPSSRSSYPYTTTSARTQKSSASASEGHPRQSICTAHHAHS
jgi:hypothetical protein